MNHRHYGLLLGAVSLPVIIALFFGGYDTVLLVIAGLTIALTLTVIADKPTAVLSFWLVAVSLFPPWVALYFLGYRIPVAAVVSLAVVFARIGKSEIAWNKCDTGVAILALSSVIAATSFGSPLHIATQTLFEWTICYAAGRFVYEGTDFMVCANRIGGMLGWLAVLQAVAKVNVASLILFNPGQQDAQWTSLQERGGQIRSELTFGHSISLGAILCILLPFALSRTRKTLVDHAFVVGILLGIVSTFSRSAMISGVISLAIYLIYSRASATIKVVGSTAMALSTWVGAGLFLDRISQSANSVELTDSTAYREGLLDLIGIVRILGIAPGGIPAEDGVTYIWDSFYSIDNGILYVGLYIGWIAALCYLIPAIYVIAKSAGKRWNPFAVALVAQVPFILTVAPITQYQNVFWLIVGAGATAANLHHSSGISKLVDQSRGGRDCRSAGVSYAK